MACGPTWRSLYTTSFGLSALSAILTYGEMMRHVKLYTADPKVRAVLFRSR